MASSEVKVSCCLGFDPGRDKCGLALVTLDRRPLYRQVVASTQAIETVQQLVHHYAPQQVILGNQTSSHHWYQQLQQALPHCPITCIDERHSSMEARQRYWDYHPPRGWNWVLPKGMRVPPSAYDDIVAQILVERYLDTRHDH